MEKNFLEIDGIYALNYPGKDKQTRYVRVLNVFPNNFIEVWCREYVDFSSLRRSQFDMGLAQKMFLDLDQVESLKELVLRD